MIQWVEHSVADSNCKLIKRAQVLHQLFQRIFDSSGGSAKKLKTCYSKIGWCHCTQRERKLTDLASVGFNKDSLWQKGLALKRGIKNCAKNAAPHHLRTSTI